MGTEAGGRTDDGPAGEPIDRPTVPWGRPHTRALPKVVEIEVAAVEEDGEGRKRRKKRIAPRVPERHHAEKGSS